jgi:predicted DNA-binding protein
MPGDIRATSLQSASRLVALNFKVPLEVRKRLKLLALQRDITMTELLLDMIEKHAELFNVVKKA